MQHTYLRYECADAFGLVSASASSKIPHSNSTLAFASSSRKSPIILTSAGSHCAGFHLRTTNPTIKLAHPEENTGGVGTGRALNSSQVVCLDVSRHVDGGGDCRVATGWVDGAVRVFNVAPNELDSEEGLVHTFLEEEKHDFISREPLVLNGHSGSPIRSISFDSSNSARLASGSSDGAVVLWDVVEECGLFRLLGHCGAITELHFVSLEGGAFDCLITSSLDGLVKVWDLKGQCCIQTIASHRGKVWASTCMVDRAVPAVLLGDGDISSLDIERARLVTGDDDGQAKVWSIRVPRRHQSPPQTKGENGEPIALVEDSGDEDSSDCCTYMGPLKLPSTMPPATDHVAGIRFHPGGKYVGVLHANARSVHVYVLRSPQETQRRKQRRVSRHRQKAKQTEESQATKSSIKNRKRGILDDAEAENIEAPVLDAVAEKIIASDEFEFVGSVNASHKVRNFVFVPWKESGSTVRIVCSLVTNALEVLSLQRPTKRDQKHAHAESTKVSMMDMLGHSTGIRAVELSSDDSLACTVSKNCFKIWNVARRKCVQSVSHSMEGQSFYGLCATFLPGNSHLVVGTREGHLLLLDVAAGEVSLATENAHDEAIWSVDLRRPTDQQPTVSLVTGSADKTVKFWDIETNDDEKPLISHARTLEMSDDVVAVRYSHSTDPSKRMVFVSCMDSTVKVFFDDTLKFFLSLYGHKLPALAVDASDDDAILATSGADKLVKIWGLDFGDTHKTLHGHADSVTDLRFVRRTHNFFTSSKDGSVRYWDGDRFEQILVLNGHFAEVSSVAISRTGACVLSAGMDRQIRVWERTKDIVFLEEEKGLELEKRFDQIDSRNEPGTGEIFRRKEGDDENEEEEPQSEAAVKQSVLSIAAGDRVLAALELADQEQKSIANFRKMNGDKEKAPNPMLLGMDPTTYILWVLRTIKHAELEQSLLVLPIEHVSRMLYYLVVLLRRGQGVEICARVAVFLVKTHQHQIQANNWKLARPLQELRRLLRLRLEESRSIVGFNLSGLQVVSKNSSKFEQTSRYDLGEPKNGIWSGIGLIGGKKTLGKDAK